MGRVNDGPLTLNTIEMNVFRMRSENVRTYYVEAVTRLEKTVMAARSVEWHRARVERC